MKVAKALEAAGSFGMPSSGKGPSPGPSRASSHSPPPKGRGMMLVPVTPACSTIVPALATLTSTGLLGPQHVSGVKSIQSLQTAQSVPSVAPTAEVSHPGARSWVPAIAVGPGVAAPGPAAIKASPRAHQQAQLARVVPVPVESLPPRAARHGSGGSDDFREKLESIQREVRTIASAQEQTEELEETRDRARDMSGQLQSLRRQNQESEVARQELRDQLQRQERLAGEAEQRLQDSERRVLDAVEAHKQVKRSLAKANEDKGLLQDSRHKLQEEQRAEQEACEANRAKAEQLNIRSQELQKVEQDLSARLKAASAKNHEAEAELSSLAETLQREREQLQDAEAEARKHADVVAQEEERTRQAQERRRVAEDSRRSAEEELRRLGEGCANANKENVALQRAGTIQEREVQDLKGQLLSEKLTSSLAKRADWKALGRAQEEECALDVENGRLKKALTKMQCDVSIAAQCIEENDNIIRQLRVGHGLR